jgi:diguanylate cyclase (GGDEF)-like protein
LRNLFLKQSFRALTTAIAMNFSKERTTNQENSNSAGYSFWIMISASLLTLGITFFILNTSLPFAVKTALFGGVVLTYLIFNGIFYYLQNRGIKNAEPEDEASNIETEESFTAEEKEKLHVLEEANSFFATSLKPADMFRLVSNRVADLIPFTACVLFLADESKSKLKVSLAVGENAADFLGLKTDCHQGLAGKVFLSRQTQLDENLSFEKTFLSAETSKNFKTAVAAPLTGNDLEVYGVLALYSAENNFDSKTVRLMNAIASRVSPLLQNSLTFERNLENALTDPLTNLPNERAFYLVLENQVAESQRLREQRPLTVLSIDIKKFDEINRKHGFGAGDEILSLAAKIIKSQLRQMDFLARSRSDEFLAILPTASEEITRVIIDRIEKAFRLNPFEAGNDESVNVQLNFGSASFIKDGETAQDLLKRAILKKQEAKSDIKSSVLYFPQEFVN